MTTAHRQIAATVCCGWFGILALAFGAGCLAQRRAPVWHVSPPAAPDTGAFATAQQTVRETFPSVYRATQRAILTVQERQFVFDGFLTVSPAEGWHLALISTLGLMADLRVRDDGSSEVLKVTPIFRETWARDYVAQNVHWLFVPPRQLTPAGRLSDGRLVLEAPEPGREARRQYVCSADGSRWEELAISQRGRQLFHAKLSRFRSLPGWPNPVPEEIEASAVTHHLHVRIARMTLPREGEP